MLLDLHFKTFDWFHLFFSRSSSSSGERRHKRRRHEKSLDRETSLWWHILAVPLCYHSVNQKKGKFKKTNKKRIPCHTQPPLYCATLCFCHSSLCASCVKKEIVRNSINARNRNTCFFFCFFSMYISVWWYQQQREATIIWHLQVTAVSMGQVKRF